MYFREQEGDSDFAGAWPDDSEVDIQRRELSFPFIDFSVDRKRREAGPPAMGLRGGHITYGYGPSICTYIECRIIA